MSLFDRSQNALGVWAAALFCLAFVGTASAEVVGPDLINRSAVDGGSNYLFMYDDGTPGFTKTGVVETWSFFNDNGTASGNRTLEPLILKQVGTNWIVTGVGAAVTTPATMSGVQSFDFNLAAGSAVVGPGYTFAHHDLGNPGSIEYTYVGGDSETHRYYYLGPGSPSVGQTIADGSFSTRQRIYSVQFQTAESFQTTGDALVDRVYNDGANGAIFLAPDGVFSGRVTEWAFFDNDNNTPNRQITPLILERVSLSQYKIVGIGTTQTTNESGEQHYPFGLVAGSDQIGPGRYFGWKDGSNGANNAGLIDYNDNSQDRIVYFGGGKTSFNVDDALNVASTLGRSYSLQFTDITSGQIVGNDLINRANNDGANGGIFIDTDPLPFGWVEEWALYDNDDVNPNRQITPLLLERVGSDYVIRGIGATRTTDELGQQSFAFDLVAGSNMVGPDTFLGWKDGSLTADNPGVIDWTDGGAGIRYFGTGHAGNVLVGRSLGGGTFYPRDYSVQARVLVPEPATAALLGLGGLALVSILRRRRARPIPAAAEKTAA